MPCGPSASLRGALARRPASRQVGPERLPGQIPLGLAHVVAGIAPVGDRGHVVAGRGAEALHQPGVVPAGEAAHDEEPGGMPGCRTAWREHDRGPEGVPERTGSTMPSASQTPTQVRPTHCSSVQVAGCTPVRAAVVPQVEPHDWAHSVRAPKSGLR